MVISEILKKALEKGILSEGDYFDIHYYRISDDMGKYKRGTFISGDTVIFSYPSIMRIMRLREGLKTHFKASPFYIEEKVDGYNVRITKIKDRVVAITRGGFICPFSTDRLSDFADFNKFFAENPGYVIAGEIAGPENPYIEVYPPYIKEDVKFFAFDVFRKGARSPIPPEERYELLSKYEIPGVRQFGKFTSSEYEKVRSVILKLNREGIEGVVIKSVDGRRVVKYTTININISDINADSWLILEMPGNFYTSRIARIGFAMDEFGINPDDDFYKRLGRAFIDGFLKSISKFKKYGRLSYTYRLRFNDDRNLALFLEHMRTVSESIKFRIIRIFRENGKHILEFEKIFLESTSKFSEVLQGGGVYD